MGAGRVIFQGVLCVFEKGRLSWAVFLFLVVLMKVGWKVFFKFGWCFLFRLFFCSA